MPPPMIPRGWCCGSIVSAMRFRAEPSKRVRKISDAIAALCTKYGGVIWGEHGKGFRSEYSPLHFGELFVHVEAVKSLFDPEQRLNPGKVATPTGKRRHLATIDQPTRGQQDRQIERGARSSNWR